MKPGNAIEIKHVTKSFKVFLDKGFTLKEKILFQNRRRYEERKVLDDISFDVKEGEAIGLIGQNGCGKSTTLKLLTRIMFPDSGSIEMKGRVSSLIELGAGFHPDMSGRENIYINAAIFGLTKKEIDSRLEDIIAFSELEEFIDNPVRTYSSGMYMRLAFAVAINVDADILLIDEILAVGDAGFQAKCINKLMEIKAAGTTIVIVSHSMGQIEQICERSIWLHEGKIREEGLPREVDPKYLDFMGQKQQNIEIKEEKRKKEQEIKIESERSEKEKEDEKKRKETEVKSRWGNGDARIVSISVLDASGRERLVYRTGDYCKFVVYYHVIKPVQDAILGIGIYRNDGLRCYGTNTRIDHLQRINLLKDGRYEIEIPHLSLLQGDYMMDFAIESGQNLPVDYYTKAKTIKITSAIEDVGVSRLEHMWHLNN